VHRRSAVLHQQPLTRSSARACGALVKG